ncbi:hypothetical protein HUJ04_006071 [Dendroctonus ponderosae]|nr:hypothetical protein HUJ04_006071 [Dendroctonus ponderosae]KAH1012100.1 hypothetical protein HUJ05_011317 [Dendroctonus ponderosae]
MSQKQKPEVRIIVHIWNDVVSLFSGKRHKGALFEIKTHNKLVFGTLYPAYASYKGVRTKNTKEYEIDEYISKAKEQSYKQFLDIGQKGVTALMQTALKSEIVQNLVQMLSLPDVVRIDQNVAPCAPASAQPGSSDEEPEPSDVQPGPSDTHHENNDKNDRLANAIRAMLAEGPPGPRTGPGKGKIKYRRNAICFEGLPD